jgi:uncharacterized protein YndB with AHSA1/START domain
MSRFAHVTYVRTTPQKLWQALTTPEMMQQYWFGCRAECDWKIGSPWKLYMADGKLADEGEILESDPPHRLVIKWRNMHREDLTAEGYSRCTMEIEDAGASVKLTIMHEIDLEPSAFIEGVSNGWPKIISSLKSLLETGQALERP